MAESAAFTCRVSSSTASNPAPVRPACSHGESGKRMKTGARGGWQSVSIIIDTREVRGLRPGDRLAVDFLGTIEGKEFAGGKATGGRGAISGITDFSAVAEEAVVA